MLTPPLSFFLIFVTYLSVWPFNYFWTRRASSRMNVVVVVGAWVLTCLPLNWIGLIDERLPYALLIVYVTGWLALLSAAFVTHLPLRPAYQRYAGGYVVLTLVLLAAGAPWIAHIDWIQLVYAAGMAAVLAMVALLPACVRRLGKRFNYYEALPRPETVHRRWRALALLTLALSYAGLALLSFLLPRLLPDRPGWVAALLFANLALLHGSCVCRARAPCARPDDDRVPCDESCRQFDELVDAMRRGNEDQIELEHLNVETIYDVDDEI